MGCPGPTSGGDFEKRIDQLFEIDDEDSVEEPVTDDDEDSE